MDCHHSYSSSRPCCNKENRLTKCLCKITFGQFLAVGFMQITTEKKHVDFMLQAVNCAFQSAPVDTAYCVGCVIVKNGEVISTGFSRELPGNTHAEESAIKKLEKQNISAEGCDLYSTMEPCSKRLSGNEPCAKRIIENSVKRVFVGVLEPANFVNCTGVQQLLDAGIEVIAVQAEGLKEKCLAPNKHVLQK
eukprot:g8109.t1